MHERINYNFYWFISLLKKFEEPFREVITFSHKDKTLYIDPYVNYRDEFMVGAIQSFAQMVAQANSLRKPVNLKSVYFIQVCNICE